MNEWILVVDDDIKSLKRASHILLSEKMRASLVRSGEEALKFLGNNVPDLILLDIHMAGMDGYETLARIREMPALTGVPVIFLTADEDSGSETRGLEAGAMDFIKKPFVPAVLLTRVHHIIDLVRLHRQEKERITHVFRRYIDPSIVEDVLREDESEQSLLSGKSVDITVLFADIRGFTTMSEKLDPQEVIVMLNQYLSIASSIIKKQRGTLDKFIGDATMAFWGAPLQCEDTAYSACKAALEIIEATKRMAEEAERRWGHQISFGIGIESGRAIVGNIGSDDRMDYTAIGNCVNTASRLQSIAPPDTIYISRNLADALGERARTIEIGKEVHLKGKAKAVEVLQLQALI